MTHFNGDKILPRLAVKAGNKTFSWLFDTGAAVTCMNKQSFDLAFRQSKPKQISKPQSCVAASGDKMSSYWMFDVDLFIKGRKFTHPVNVIQELNENIIGIDFIHTNKLTYEVISRKVKFAGARTNSIAAFIYTVLPAMTSTIVKAKFKATRTEKATYVATICAPRTPMILGMRML
jgi:Retroviral aspartyl protease